MPQNGSEWRIVLAVRAVTSFRRAVRLTLAKKSSIDAHAREAGGGSNELRRVVALSLEFEICTIAAVA
jgi:hypothetical protein